MADSVVNLGGGGVTGGGSRGCWGGDLAHVMQSPSRSSRSMLRPTGASFRQVPAEGGAEGGGEAVRWRCGGWRGGGGEGSYGGAEGGAEGGGEAVRWRCRGGVEVARRQCGGGAKMERRRWGGGTEAVRGRAQVRG